MSISARSLSQYYGWQLYVNWGLQLFSRLCNFLQPLNLKLRQNAVRIISYTLTNVGGKCSRRLVLTTVAL